MSRARDLADGTFDTLKVFDSALTDSLSLSVNTSSSYVGTVTQDDTGLTFNNNTAIRGYTFKNNTSNTIITLDSDGLKFNGDTAAANALDDYEEGTWTPTLAGAVSYGQQWGSYIKVGNVVSFTIFISISSGATSNTLRVSLPFASLSGADRYHAYRGWQNSWSSSGNSVQWLHSAGASEIKAYNLVSSGGVSTLTETAVGTGNFIVTGSYRTS